MIEGACHALPLLLHGLRVNQGRLVAALVDQGVLRTTLTKAFGRLSAAELKRAHAQLESGTTIGKVVLEVK